MKARFLTVGERDYNYGKWKNYYELCMLTGMGSIGKLTDFKIYEEKHTELILIRMHVCTFSMCECVYACFLSVH